MSTDKIIVFSWNSFFFSQREKTIETKNKTIQKRFDMLLKEKEEPPLEIKKQKNCCICQKSFCFLERRKKCYLCFESICLKDNCSVCINKTVDGKKTITVCKKCYSISTNINKSFHPILIEYTKTQKEIEKICKNIQEGDFHTFNMEWRKLISRIDFVLSKTNPFSETRGNLFQKIQNSRFNKIQKAFSFLIQKHNKTQKIKILKNKISVFQEQKQLLEKKMKEGNGYEKKIAKRALFEIEQEICLIRQKETVALANET